MAKFKQRYLTVQEFAGHMGVSVQAVYQAIREKRVGNIAGFGERIAIPHQELSRFKKRRGPNDFRKVLRRPSHAAFL
jgi:excisionase family DNA binding protein